METAVFSGAVSIVDFASCRPLFESTGEFRLIGSEQDARFACYDIDILSVVMMKCAAVVRLNCNDFLATGCLSSRTQNTFMWLESRMVSCNDDDRLV